jgi:hypothetical protein
VTESRDIQGRFDAWLEEFSELWLTRGLAQLLPGGRPVDAMISGRLARVQRQRFELFAMEVYEEIARVDNAKVDWAFFNSDEGTDVFARIAQEAINLLWPLAHLAKI